MIACASSHIEYQFLTRLSRSALNLASPGLVNSWLNTHTEEQLHQMLEID